MEQGKNTKTNNAFSPRSVVYSSFHTLSPRPFEPSLFPPLAFLFDFLLFAVCLFHLLLPGILCDC